MKKKPYIIASLFFLIDFLSKQIIVNVLSIGKSIKIINQFFYLTYTKNTGAAWSILKDQRILLLIVTVVVLFLINEFMKQETLTKLENLAYGMIIGGILGNMLDRILFGAVIDFLDFKIFGYDYPIFNLADSFIVVGIIIFVIASIRKEHNEKNKSRKK